MPSVPVRIVLFFSSYFPLTLILSLLFLKVQPIWSGIILAAGVLSVALMLWYFFLYAPKFNAIQETVTGYQGRDADVMSYIASYIIPFVAIPFSGWEQGVALLIFVFVLGYVYVNSNMIYINPMLNICGFHLYEITVKNDEAPYSLITRRRVVRGETLRIIKIGNGIFLEKGA